MCGGVGSASCVAVAAADDVGIDVADDVAVWNGMSGVGVVKKYDPGGGNDVGADVCWYIDE